MEPQDGAFRSLQALQDLSRLCESNVWALDYATTRIGSAAGVRSEADVAGKGPSSEDMGTEETEEVGGGPSEDAALEDGEEDGMEGELPGWGVGSSDEEMESGSDDG